MEKIEPILYLDPQCRREKRCPICDGCVYPPGYHCIRCERRRPNDPCRTEPML